MTVPRITITDWKERRQGTLRGFCTLHLPSGLTLHEVMLHTRNDQWWVTPPSKPMIGKDDRVLRDPDGKLRYSPIVSFESRAARDRFNQSVLDALRLARPEVFADAEAMP